MKNRDRWRLIAWLIAAGSCTFVHGVEPDEGGIGGTGHSESTLSEPIFERPDIPERIEVPNRPEFPDFPESAPAAGAGIDFSPPSVSTPTDNPVPVTTPR